MNWTLIGALFGGLSVILGAFGAHALRAHLPPASLEIYKTAIQYLFFHALALIGLGVWSKLHPKSNPARAGWCFVMGTFIFSGSLIELALTDIKIFGALAPIGGTLLILGWLLFAKKIYKA